MAFSKEKNWKPQLHVIYQNMSRYIVPITKK